MAAVITVNDESAETISPALVLGWRTVRESQNIVHDIIGGGVGITLIRPRPRSGTLALFFLDEATAVDAHAKLARETTFTLADSDLDSVTMTFVAVGQSALNLDDETRERWTLDVGYQEIEV